LGLGSLSNTFFQWAALFFLMTTRLLDFLLALSEEKKNPEQVLRPKTSVGVHPGKPDESTGQESWND